MAAAETMQRAPAPTRTTTVGSGFRALWTPRGASSAGFGGKVADMSGGLGAAGWRICLGTTLNSDVAFGTDEKVNQKRLRKNRRQCRVIQVQIQKYEDESIQYAKNSTPAEEYRGTAMKLRRGLTTGLR